MSLLKRCDEDLKVAMKAADKLKVSVLRMAKSSVKNKQIDKGRELTDDEILAVLSSMIKQRRESIEQYTKAARMDLAQNEEQEVAIIQTYMPRQFSYDEIDKIIQSAIDESSAKGGQDMGKVMRIVMPKITGVADGKYVSQRVKELLAS